MDRASLALTIFFGLLSLVFYLRGRRKKRLTFTYQIAQLHSRTHPEIKILFRDKPVQNLSRLRVVVWNSGNQEVRQTDIPEDHGPTITFTDAHVLSVAVLEATSDINCVAKEKDENVVEVGFDFLNVEDFATVDILYEVSEAEPHIGFKARLIGGLPSIATRFEQPLHPMNWIAPGGFTLLWCIGLLFWAKAIPRWLHRVPEGISVDYDALWYLIGLLVGAIFCWSIFKEYIRKHRASRLPQSARRSFLT